MTLIIWICAVAFDPQAMARPSSPVDGLLAAFLPWVVVGVMGGIALLPFAVRRRRHWSHVLILASVAATAAIAAFYAITSARNIAYSDVAWVADQMTCPQGLAMVGCTVGLLRLATLPAAPPNA